MNKTNFLFIVICVFFIISANFAEAKIPVVNGTTTQLVKEKMTTCTKQGIQLAVEGLKNLQVIVFNFYSTKVAPKTDFWVMDIITRFKAGILSSVKEKLDTWFNNLQEKFLHPKNSASLRQGIGVFI
jgi:hypothetical protein